ncbi:unnamed protein product [Arctogadus glacialis]
MRKGSSGGCSEWGGGVQLWHGSKHSLGPQCLWSQSLPPGARAAWVIVPLAVGPTVAGKDNKATKWIAWICILHELNGHAWSDRSGAGNMTAVGQHEEVDAAEDDTENATSGCKVI